MNNVKLAESLYTELLQRYLTRDNKNCVTDAEEMSKYFIRKNIYPEEIIRIHSQAINHIFEEKLSEPFLDTFEFLEHSLSNYRKTYDYYQRMERERKELKSEIEVAAAMQQTLLASDVPNIPDLEIGAIS